LQQKPRTILKDSAIRNVSLSLFGIDLVKTHFKCPREPIPMILSALSPRAKPLGLLSSFSFFFFSWGQGFPSASILCGSGSDFTGSFGSGSLFRKCEISVFKAGKYVKNSYLG